MKRKEVLEKKKRKKNVQIETYRMVTDFEPTFPDIRKAIKNLDTSSKMTRSLRRSSKNVISISSFREKRKQEPKEILAPSTIKFRENEEERNHQPISDQDPEGCYPCKTPRACCLLLCKLQGNTFQSVATKKSFKIRQNINCKSKNVIYLVTCVKCNIQGVGHYTQFNKRVANYFSHIKSITRDCEITCHFIDHHSNTWKANYIENEEFSVEGIVKLEHPLKSKRIRK